MAEIIKRHPINLAPTAKRFLAVGASLATLGAGIGFWVEKNDDSVASGRAYTASTCLKAYGTHVTSIDRQMLDCLQSGVPGGDKSGKGFHEGEPNEVVQAFQVREAERSHFETGHVAEWAVGVPVVAAVAMIVF